MSPLSEVEIPAGFTSTLLLDALGAQRICLATGLAGQYPFPTTQSCYLPPHITRLTGGADGAVLELNKD